MLEGDVAFGHLADVAELPPAQLDRLKHYFLTYKQPPAEAAAVEGVRSVEVTDVYGRDEAHQVIEWSREDYRDLYPDLRERFFDALNKPEGAD